MRYKPKHRILVIPDTHFPFCAPGTFAELSHIKRDLKPDLIIHSGDLVDQHTLGKWTPEPDAMGTLDELKEAQAQVAKLAKLFPKLWICLGNHDKRVYKRLKDEGVPNIFLRQLPEVLGAPASWRFADNFTVNNVHYFHGDGFSGKGAALAAAESFRRCVVMGHVHAFAGVAYSAGPKDTIWGMNVGCLIDNERYAFRYGKEFKHKPVMGVGFVEDGIPRFVPI